MDPVVFNALLGTRPKETRQRVWQFFTSGSWIVPPGVQHLEILGVGGGGSGGACVNASAVANSPGAQGGCGGEVRDAALTVNPGDRIDVVIGQGGAQQSTAGNGNNGSDTTVSLNFGATVITFAGGLGGSGLTTTGSTNPPPYNGLAGRPASGGGGGLSVTLMGDGVDGAPGYNGLGGGGGGGASTTNTTAARGGLGADGGGYGAGGASYPASAGAFNSGAGGGGGQQGVAPYFRGGAGGSGYVAITYSEVS